MRITKKHISLIGLSVLICFLLMIFPGFIRSYSIIHGFWVCYLAYFFTIIFLLSKFNEHKAIILASFVSTLLLIEAFIYYNDGVYNLATATLLCLISACLFGYLVLTISINLFIQADSASFGEANEHLVFK